ncbi:MAG TPA: membrane protein insertase YidC [Bacteroidales bacterium]|nr:membrane protein insertase YidC [Bacteroidales bacterium]HPS15602.1 membrane protein insertase YidC [Bacteroidales bacterium]
MNKNTIIGLVLIIGIMAIFSYINRPSEAEIKKRQHEQDSIALALKKNDSIAVAESKIKKLKSDSLKTDTGSVKTSNDSSVSVKQKDELGIFAGSAQGEKKTIIVENEIAKFKFNTFGGGICYIQLKNYKTFDKKPIVLYHSDSSLFGLKFYADNRVINTSELNYSASILTKKFNGKDSIKLSGNDSVKIAMRLFPDSAVNPDRSKYIELCYTIPANEYMIKTSINLVGMGEIITASQSSMDLNWNMNLNQLEKSLKTERASSTIYYKYYEDEVDYLSETKSDSKDLKTKISWIGYKQQFFSSVMIADNGFLNGKIATNMSDTAKFNKSCTSTLTVPVDNKSLQSFPMRMYFGPNHYKTLRKYDLDLERQIPLGWSSPYILGWINRFAVIPIFNWLENTGISYGIIILILTIILKIVLFPIAYKTYLSGAKMRVLKPEIDEINNKIPKEKAMERQQATMALYKKAGVNPMAGCVPMLLQMPILIALFRFFPASIELRQQSFLWATDLSSYDSIYDFGFKIPFYGDHISLFCLLMTISTIIYTRLNNQLMGTQQQMPGMKFMTYAMPIMFLGILNDFSAGLNYYYFLANMFTFLQMWIIRKTINEEKIHARIQENKRKSSTRKKSGFQKRLEEMAKQRGYNPPKR